MQIGAKAAFIYSFLCYTHTDFEHLGGIVVKKLSQMNNMCVSTIFLVMLIIVLVSNSALADPTVVSLLCKTTDNDQVQNFGITFKLTDSTWSQQEPVAPGNPPAVFTTKSGTFVTVANITSLKNGSTVVSELDNFSPKIAQSSDSIVSAKAFETGRVFDCNVSTIIQ